MPAGDLRFLRLGEVAIDQIITQMSDAAVVAHMPLAKRVWDDDFAREFVRAKEACWSRDGLGHWAIYLAETYVGWGGFQKEGPDWDFGLVLRPEFFGLGQRITTKAIEFARSDPRIPYVTFLLPPTRKKLAALGRIGVERMEDVEMDGVRFMKFRLQTCAQ